MRLLLDTNRYGDLIRREPTTVDRFQRATEVWISLVTVGELRAGFYRGRQFKKNERQLRDMLDVQGVGLLAPDEETTSYYGRTHADLRSAGAMIPTNDIWIAAQALQHNLMLDTRDEHFHRVKGLQLVV